MPDLRKKISFKKLIRFDIFKILFLILNPHKLKYPCFETVQLVSNGTT